MMAMRSVLAAALGCLVSACLSLPVTAAAQELLPNLRAFPASELSVVADPDTGNPELRFSTVSWNSGVGPLELVVGAVVDAGQEVYQRVYLQGGGFTDYLAGTFVFHPTHAHFHFQEYALYTLRQVNSSSKRDAYKTSFCVMDTTKVDTRLPGAAKRAVYTSCGTSVQGMSVGWGDRYGSHLAGQEIDITNLPDGLYELEIKIDPSSVNTWGRLRETNEDDNTACSLVQLSATNLTVQDMGPCGSTPSSGVTITSITPNTGVVGSIVQVIIRGENFSSGIAVGFENGAGATPVVSNVIVQDSTTIAAVVTIKNSGKLTDPIWDLRVGSAVKPNAFTVTR